MLPKLDRIMHSEKEFKTEDLIKYLPATRTELMERLKMSDLRIKSMIYSLVRQGLIHYDEGKWQVQSRSLR